MNKILEGLSEEERKLFDELPDAEKEAFLSDDEPSPEAGAETSGNEEGAEHEADEHAEEQNAEDSEEGGSEDGEKKHKLVPLPALHEERKRRQELQERLRRMEIERAKVEERLRMLFEAQQKAQQQEKVEEKPDPEVDPIEYVKSLGNEVQQLRQMTEAERQMQQQQQQLAQMVNYGNQLAASYREQVGPDVYDKAFQHVAEARANELKALGYDERQIPSILQQELQAGMIEAIQRQRNPGEVLMEIARARGFNPDALKQQSEGSPDKSADKLNKVAEGQKKLKGLGKSGKRTSGAPSAEELAKMSDEEFQKLVDSLNEDGIDELLKKAMV
jgi:hypothetical protein